MNELLKLAVAFTTGVVVTFLFIGFINNAEAPSYIDAGDSETSEEMPATEDNLPNEETPDSSVNTVPPQPYTPPAQPAKSYPTSEIVSFTGDKMVPNEVVIIEGGSVTFVNATNNRTMWIASHAHPLHNAYRESSSSDCSGSTFDQCGVALPGGSWTFRFNLPGKWFYHEEGNQTVTGLVNVLTKEQFDTRY